MTPFDCCVCHNNSSSSSYCQCCKATVTMATFKVWQGTLSVTQLVPLSQCRFIENDTVFPLQFVRSSLLTKSPACCDSGEPTGVIRLLSVSLDSSAGSQLNVKSCKSVARFYDLVFSRPCSPSGATHGGLGGVRGACCLFFPFLFLLYSLCFLNSWAFFLCESHLVWN